jgi:tetratricopeptide (TPR) repeat protein
MLSYNLGENYIEQALEMFNLFEQYSRDEHAGSAEDQSLVHLTRGIIYYRNVVDYSNAIADFTVCINLGQSDFTVRALKLRAKCFIDIGDLQSALSDYKILVNNWNIEYGPALKFMFCYMFQNDTSIATEKLPEAYDLLKRSLGKPGGIKHQYLHESLGIRLQLEDSNRELQSQNSTRSRATSRAGVQSNKNRSRSVKSNRSETPEPVATTPDIDQMHSFIQNDPLAEYTFLREMIANVIVRLWTQKELENRKYCVCHKSAAPNTRI